MSGSFREIFRCPNDPKNQRAKYLSRLFGIFSERVVSAWAADERAPYRNLGRPTLRHPDRERRYTLDFTLQDRTSGNIYAAEMKCEIEYMNFRYFVLEETHQLDHHKKPAFELFLEAAHSPQRISVRVQGKPVEINGAILIWGAVDTSAKGAIISEMGFQDILSLEDITRDLADWQNREYLELIERYRSWSNGLFDRLRTSGSSGR
jgi:hypothetical protein